MTAVYLRGRECVALIDGDDDSVIERFMREQGVTYELKLETRRTRAVEER